MTEEQEALVEALRLFSADQGIGFDRMHNQMAAGLIEPIGEDLCDSTFSVTPAGRFVLALAKERDLWRLKAEWQEAAVKSLEAAVEYNNACMTSQSEKTALSAWKRKERAESRADKAKAAYVAAGGVVLWQA